MALSRSTLPGMDTAGSLEGAGVERSLADAADASSRSADVVIPPGNRARPRELPTPGLARTVQRVGVVGVGSYAPDRVLSNADLEKLVDTSHDWIVERTGMVERRIAAPDQAASDLAVTAAARALENAGLSPADVELIIVATATPDHPCPATACYVQQKLGATRAAGFDVAAACSGFLVAMTTAHGLLASGSFRNALVIGAEVLSSITNYEERESCILFGDGAGAAVLGTDPAQGELLDNIIGMDGEGADLIIVPAGGSQRPASADTVSDQEHYLSIQGRKVFRFAVAKLCELTHTLLERNGFTLDDIDLLVPHQANLRIIEAGAKKLGIEMERVFVNIDRYGNTSSGVRAARPRRGDGLG